MKPRAETPKGGNTRNKIINSAIKLSARHGFADASFQMIADDIKLSQSAVMYHFRDKNALFEEMVRAIIRNNHELVSGLMAVKDGAGRRLMKHCLGNVAWALRSKKQDGQILLLLYYLAGRGGRFSEVFEGMIARDRERILAHLLAGTREGVFKLKGDPAAVTETIQDALFGAMLYAASAQEKAPTPAALEKKWGDFLWALTCWKNDAPGSLLPWNKF